MNYDTLIFWILLLLWGVFALAFYKRSSPSKIKTHDITLDAMFIGIIILMGAVPQLGYIQILPWLSLTLLHLPVLIGAYLFGWKRGLLYGTAFGVTSWIVALTRSTGTHVTLGDDSGNLPKLWVNLSNLISACALAEHTLATNRININTNFFIFFFFLSYFLVYS